MTTHRKTLILVFVILALALVPLTAQATAYTWTGTTSNAWNLSTNWTGGTFPNATTDQATINLNTHNPVSLTTTASLGGTGIGPSGDLNYALYIGSSAGATGLDIAATTGILQMTGSIFNSEIITIEGILRNQTTSSTGSHPFNINGPGSITLAGGTITSNNTHGGWTFNQAINGYGTINNSSPNTLTSTMTATNNATPITLTAGTFNLAGGTLARTGTAAFTDSATIAGYGTVSAPFTGTGTFSANSGTYGQAININNVTQTGAVTLGFANKGTYNLSNVTLGNSGNTGTILTFSGTTTYSQFTNPLPGTFGNNWGNVNYGLANVTGDTTLNGHISLANYYVFNITNSTLTVNNPGTITGFNTSSPPVFVLGTGGNLNLTGDTTLGTSAPIPINGGSLTHTGGAFNAYAFIGYGSISGVTSLAGGGNVLASGGTALTPQTLTFDVGSGASLGSHSGAGATLSSSANNTLDLKGTYNYLNPGIIAPNGGIVQLDGATLNTYDPTGGSGGTPTTWNVTLNPGTVNVTNNSTMIGNISSNATLGINGKQLDASGATFTNNNLGTVHVTNGTAIWGNFTNNGAYISDPSTSTFNTLTVGSTGSLTGATGDVFQIKGNFTNNSTQNSSWNTSAATLAFLTGTSSAHNVALAGADLGQSLAGYTNNFAWKTLDLTGQTLTLSDGNTGNTGTALYVGNILGLLFSGTTVTDITGTQGANIYYDSLLNPGLLGLTYNLEGSGFLEPVPASPVPISPSVLLLGSGLLGLGLLRWRRRKVSQA